MRVGECVGEGDRALLQFIPGAMGAREQDQRVDQAHQRPTIAARPQFAVSAAVTFEAVEEQAAVCLQRAGVTQQFADGLIEVTIVTGRVRQRREERTVDVHAIDPDLPAPARRVAAVVSLAVRAGRKACVERGELAGGVEELLVLCSLIEREQFAAGADVIFVAACDAFAQPAAQNSVNETKRRWIVEQVTCVQESAQSDGFTEAPHAIVPAHGDRCRGFELGTVHRRSRTSRIGRPSRDCRAALAGSIACERR